MCGITIAEALFGYLNHPIISSYVSASKITADDSFFLEAYYACKILLPIIKDSQKSKEILLQIPYEIPNISNLLFSQQQGSLSSQQKQKESQVNFSFFHCVCQAACYCLSSSSSSSLSLSTLPNNAIPKNSTSMQNDVKNNKNINGNMQGIYLISQKMLQLLCEWMWKNSEAVAKFLEITEVLTFVCPVGFSLSLSSQ